MSDKSVFDQFAQSFGNAIADIREKVVEEPMYGRIVTDKDAAPQWPQAEAEQPGFGSLTQHKEKTPEKGIDR